MTTPSAQLTGSDALQQVVPELKLTLDELAAFDGTKRPSPIYLAIRGIIFDVTRGLWLEGRYTGSVVGGVVLV